VSEVAARAVRLPHHGLDRPLPHPPAAALVGQDVAPAARAGRLSALVAAVANRSGPRDQHDAGPVARAGFQRNQRVVHHQHRRFVADAAHDAADDSRILGSIDAAIPRQMTRGLRLPHHRLLHHLVQDLLDLQFAQ
jgi:hypothetical protein